MVHVAPGFTLEVSGLGQERVEVSGGGEGIQVAANGGQTRIEGVYVPSEASGSTGPQVS